MPPTLAAAHKADASATLGVPTPALTTAEELGTEINRRTSALKVSQRPVAIAAEFDQTDFICFEVNSSNSYDRTFRQLILPTHLVDRCFDQLLRCSLAYNQFPPITPVGSIARTFLQI